MILSYNATASFIAQAYSTKMLHSSVLYSRTVCKLCLHPAEHGPLGITSSDVSFSTQLKIRIPCNRRRAESRIVMGTSGVWILGACIVSKHTELDTGPQEGRDGTGGRLKLKQQRIPGAW